MAFFGFGGPGVGVGFGFGGLGWVPLAPYERYSPWYGRGIYGGYRNANVFAGSANVIHNTNLAGMYRNARVSGAVTGVSSQDFAQGRFNNRMSVSGSEIRQAGLVRGALPMAPQRENLRVTDRAASSAARISSSQGRFFSRSQPSAVNRVPFEQQRQSLQQAGAAVARQSSASAMPGGGGRSAMQGSGATSPGIVSPRSVSPQSAPSTGGGWRRFGEPSRDVPSTASGSASRTTTAGAGRAQRRSQPEFQAVDFQLRAIHAAQLRLCRLAQPVAASFAAGGSAAGYTLDAERRIKRRPRLERAQSRKQPAWRQFIRRTQQRRWRWTLRRPRPLNEF